MINQKTDLNKILNYVIKEKNGHYCHVLEVHDIYELQSCIENITDEFINLNFSINDIINFFDSITIYSLSEENEEEVYNFDIVEYIKSNF